MKFVVPALVAILVSASAFADGPSTSHSEMVLPAGQDKTLADASPEASAVEEDDCSDKALLACLGIDHTGCESLRADVVSECTLPMAREILSSGGEIGDNLELEHAKCTLLLAHNSYQIAPERYMGCMPAGTYEKPDLINEWLKSR